MKRLNFFLQKLYKTFPCVLSWYKDWRVWKNSWKFSGHTVDFVTRLSLASVCGYLRTSFCSRVFHEMVVVFFFNEIVACFVSRIVLQDNATTRDQNVEHRTCSTRFGRFQVAFIVGLTSSNLKSECNAIVALSLRSLPFDQKRSLRLRFYREYRRDSHIDW